MLAFRQSCITSRNCAPVVLKFVDRDDRPDICMWTVVSIMNPLVHAGSVTERQQNNKSRRENHARNNHVLTRQRSHGTSPAFGVCTSERWPPWPAVATKRLTPATTSARTTFAQTVCLVQQIHVRFILERCSTEVNLPAQSLQMPEDSRALQAHRTPKLGHFERLLQGPQSCRACSRFHGLTQVYQGQADYFWPRSGTAKCDHAWQDFVRSPRGTGDRVRQAVSPLKIRTPIVR